MSDSDDSIELVYVKKAPVTQENHSSASSSDDEDDADDADDDVEIVEKQGRFQATNNMQAERLRYDRMRLKKRSYTPTAQVDDSSDSGEEQHAGTSRRRNRKNDPARPQMYQGSGKKVDSDDDSIICIDDDNNININNSVGGYFNYNYDGDRKDDHKQNAAGTEDTSPSKLAKMATVKAILAELPHDYDSSDDEKAVLTEKPHIAQLLRSPSPAPGSTTAVTVNTVNYKDYKDNRPPQPMPSASQRRKTSRKDLIKKRRKEVRRIKEEAEEVASSTLPGSPARPLHLSHKGKGGQPPRSILDSRWNTNPDIKNHVRTETDNRGSRAKLKGSDMFKVRGKSQRILLTTEPQAKQGLKVRGKSVTTSKSKPPPAKNNAPVRGQAMSRPGQKDGSYLQDWTDYKPKKQAIDPPFQGRNAVEKLPPREKKKHQKEKQHEHKHEHENEKKRADPQVVAGYNNKAKPVVEGHRGPEQAKSQVKSTRAPSPTSGSDSDHTAACLEELEGFGGFDGFGLDFEVTAGSPTKGVNLGEETGSGDESQVSELESPLEFIEEEFWLGDAPKSFPESLELSSRDRRREYLEKSVLPMYDGEVSDVCSSDLYDSSEDEEVDDGEDEIYPSMTFVSHLNNFFIDSTTGLPKWTFTTFGGVGKHWIDS
jgi:hypothetical protein